MVAQNNLPCERRPTANLPARELKGQDAYRLLSCPVWPIRALPLKSRAAALNAGCPRSRPSQLQEFEGAGCNPAASAGASSRLGSASNFLRHRMDEFDALKVEIEDLQAAVDNADLHPQRPLCGARLNGESGCTPSDGPDAARMDGLGKGI